MTATDRVLTVIDALETASIPYMVVGALSSNAYGIPRSTQDADLVIELGNTPFSAFTSKLGPGFDPDPQMSFETITSSAKYEVRVRGMPFRFEFFLLNSDPHNQERFRRRRRELVLGRPVWLPTVEDVIIMKLRWALLAKRSKDLDDARNVIAVREDQIDWDYVHKWCDAHGTRSLLDEIRKSIPKE